MTTHGVDGKVVIVTGSGQGIGRGMALHLGKNGASIVVAEWPMYSYPLKYAMPTEHLPLAGTTNAAA